MITSIKEKRTFTISSIFVKSTWKRSIKPKLTLSGDWMQKAGFEIGEKVKVTVKNKKLIIEKQC